MLNTLGFIHLYRSISDGGKRTIYILNDEDKCTIIATYIKQLTDLKVLACNSNIFKEFAEHFERSHVREKYIIKYLLLIKIKSIINILFFHDTFYFVYRY